MNQKNVFNNGLIKDLPTVETPPNIITDGLNLSITTNNGNELLLQSQSSNIYLNTSLSGDFIPLCTKTFNNVNYTVSIRRDVTTGIWMTEIGSYPSPDYSIQPDDNGNSEGKMIYKYHPLVNYMNEFIDNPTREQIEDITNYKPFATRLFNHRPDFPCEMEIQSSYDDTVNLIITDNNNSPKIINTRFSVYENDKFKIYNRKGNKDTNLYNKYDFNSVLNHIPVTNKILKVDFNSFSEGDLKVGNYRYYFKYVTSDGNETDVINQSFTIPVYIGDKVNSIRGGITNETSNKGINIQLDNIDQSYAYIKIYFSFATGNTISFFRILSNYNILSTNMILTHYGYEDVQNLGTSEELNYRFSNVQTWRSQTQVDNRLLIANIKQKVYNKEAFENFARKIKIGHKIEYLEVKGTNNDENITDLFTDNYLVTSQDTYRNPKNVYNKIGYWRGESYPFAVVFILKDGSESAAFPVYGIDNLLNNADYTPSGFVNPIGSVNSYSFDVTSGRNYSGIYRFPHHENLGVRLLNNNRVSILGVTFDISDAMGDNVLSFDVLSEAMGLYFVRGERIADVITQGYLLPTINTMKSFSGDEFDYSDFDDQLKTDINSGVFDVNHKVFPLVRGYYESPRDADFLGVFTGRFNRIVNTASGSVESWNPRYYGFYSPDYFVDERKYSQVLNNKRQFSKQLYKVQGTLSNYQKLKSPVKGFVGDLTGDRFYPTYSLYKTHTTQLATSENFLPFTSYWAPGYVFSSLSEFVTAENLFNPNSLPVRLNWNSYVGLKYEAPYLLSDIINSFTSADTVDVIGRGNPDNSDNVTPYTLDGNIISYLVNIYPNNLIRSTSELNNIYNPDNISYTQISPKYYFSEQDFANSNSSAMTTEGLVISGDVIPAFGGDCFINVTYRRLYSGLLDSQGSPIEAPGIYIQPIGQILSLVTESNHNAAFRENQVLDVVEGERTFLPFSTTSGNLNSSFGSFRNNTRPETSNYNYGDSYIKSDIVTVSLPSYAPFIDSKFETRIMYSQNHINAGSYNGYRNIRSSSKEDYPRNYGEIVRIHSLNGALLVVFEKAVAYVSVNQQSLAGSNLTGSIIVDSEKVLNPKMTLVSEEYGSTYQWSVEKTDNTVYGVDVNQSKIWRVEGKSLKLLSDMSIQAWLRQRLDKFKNKSPIVSIIDVRTHYDTFKKDVDFVFYDDYKFYDSVNPQPASNVCTCPEGAIAIIDKGIYSCADFTNTCPSGTAFVAPNCVKYDIIEPVFKGLKMWKEDGYINFQYDPQYYSNIPWGSNPLAWSLCIGLIEVKITYPQTITSVYGPGNIDLSTNTLSVFDTNNDAINNLLDGNVVYVSGQLMTGCSSLDSCLNAYLCYGNKFSPVFDASITCPPNYQFIDDTCKRMVTSVPPVVTSLIYPCGCSCNDGFFPSPSGCTSINYSCPSGTTYYENYNNNPNICVRADITTPTIKGLTLSRTSVIGWTYSQIALGSDYPLQSFYDVLQPNSGSFRIEYKVNGVITSKIVTSFSIGSTVIQLLTDDFTDILGTPQQNTGTQAYFPSKITNLQTGLFIEYDFNSLPSCPNTYTYNALSNLCIRVIDTSVASSVVVNQPCISNTSKRYACRNGIAVEDPSGTYAEIPNCEKPDNTRVKSYENITFNELLNKWITRNSWIPIMSFNLNGQFNTWNVKKETHKFWKHNSNNPEIGTYYNYYGDQYTMEFEFVVRGETTDISKMFDNLMIIGNNLKVPPVYIISTTENDSKIQQIVERVSGNILTANYEHRENIDLIVLGKNLLANQILIPVSDTRIRGKFCKFRVIYNSGSYTIIQSINTIGRTSYS